MVNNSLYPSNVVEAYHLRWGNMTSRYRFLGYTILVLNTLFTLLGTNKQKDPRLQNSSQPTQTTNGVNIHVESI